MLSSAHGKLDFLVGWLPFTVDSHEANVYADPPFLPASLALSLPGSNDPLDALPPFELISR